MLGIRAEVWMLIEFGFSHPRDAEKLSKLATRAEHSFA
jgi:hypothetical protein